MNVYSTDYGDAVLFEFEAQNRVQLAYVLMLLLEVGLEPRFNGLLLWVYVQWDEAQNFVDWLRDTWQDDDELWFDLHNHTDYQPSVVGQQLTFDDYVQEEPPTPQEKHLWSAFMNLLRQGAFSG